MKENRLCFKMTDILYFLGVILPMLFGMLLRVLFAPASGGVSITGAVVFFTLPTPLSPLPITESQVNSWLVMLSLFFLCLYLTHGMQERPESRRQYAAEWLVEKTESLVRTNMGEEFLGFAPLIGAILALSAFSSMVSLLGLYAPTADFNIAAGWALLVFILITYFKLKRGFYRYLKSFTEPAVLLTPLNIISEAATPVSMAFRHYGNILSGAVVSALISAGLRGLSSRLLRFLPGMPAGIPFLQVGLPAVLSVYFDVFSGCLQAFIFAMLTMLYIADAS